MPDLLSFSELDDQRGELLPARTLLSTSSPGTSSGNGGGSLGEAVAKMLGFSNGGQSAAGPDGAPGHGDN